MFPLASVEGVASIHSPAPRFAEAFVRRVRAGLLPGGSVARNRYAVTQQSPQRLGVRAEGWPTALAVGLNDVELDVSAGGKVRYRIRYARWSAYAVSLSAVIGIGLMAALIVMDVRAYVQQHSSARIPGFSLQQNVMAAWVMAIFWGFAWPWILIALHRRPLRRLLEQIIAEVDASAAA
jgi:hypothetical protein